MEDREAIKTLLAQNKELFAITSKLNGEYLKTQQGMEKFLNTKPVWFHDHERDDDRRFDEIIKSNANQTKILNKIDSWFEDMTLGKKIKWEWVTSTSKLGGAVLVVLAVLAAIWEGIKFMITNALAK